MSDWATPKVVWTETSVDFSSWLSQEVPEKDRTRVSIIVAETLGTLRRPVDAKEASRVLAEVKRRLLAAGSH